MSDQQHNTVDRLHWLVTTMTNDDISVPQTDKRTRFIERCQIAFDAIETIRALDAEVVRLQSMVAQMNGLANKGGEIKAIRVLVCGGRDFDNAMQLGSWLGCIDNQRGISCIIHGAAKGAVVGADNV